MGCTEDVYLQLYIKQKMVLQKIQILNQHLPQLVYLRGTTRALI